MFKFVIPAILLGGLSSRIGVRKGFLKVNSVQFIDKIIFSLFYIGFSKFIISGYSCSFFCIRDIFVSYGPIGAFYSLFFNSNIYKYRHVLFLPLDMFLFNRCMLINLIKNIGKYDCVSYKFNIFPIFLSLSKNIKYVFYYFNNKFNIFSINKFLLSLSSLYININYINFFSLKNVNVILELDMYNKFYKD